MLIFGIKYCQACIILYPKFVEKNIADYMHFINNMIVYLHFEIKFCKNKY